MKRGKWLIAAVVLVVAASVGWWFASPWWTLWGIRTAAEQRDANRLSAYVDRAALSQDVSEQIRERAGSGASLGVVEHALLGGLAEVAVQAVTSPDGMRAIFAAAPAASTVPRRKTAYGIRADNMEMRREGLDQFRLVPRDGRGPELVFHRHGLGWKLAGLRLPDDFKLLES